MNTSTDDLKLETAESDGGNLIGQASTSLVAFYGATPVDQPASADQFESTDSSGGTADASTGIAALTGTYNSAILANAIATLAAQGNAVRNALVELGLIKGGA